MNRRGCFLGIFLLFVTALLPARGGREKAAPVVQVTGVVRLVGSSLFPELVITGSEKEWHIAKEDRNKLHDLQHRVVTVEGVETIIELKFASGLPAGRRRELRNVKVITVQE